MPPNPPHPLALNQSSFQDYLDCPRRFELGVLKATPWPSASSSPISKFESLTDLGNHFHQLCQQFFIGIDPDLLSSLITDPDLTLLWEKFLPYGRSLQGYPLYSEQTLRVPFGNHFLVAKFDLIAKISENDFMIIDWKSSSTKPSRTLLAKRFQSLLYPFIFQLAGPGLFALDAIPSSAIQLQYWYPRADDPEEIFPYSEAMHQENNLRISNLVHQIDEAILAGAQFPLTDNQEHCEYCIFRSYCDRAHTTSPVPPGVELETEDLSNTHFDLDMINEIEY